MRFTVSQSSLTKALAVVSKGMASNSTLPILSGVRVSAAEGTLELQTTNLAISIRHKVPANVEEPGETVISGKILSSIVKTLPDAAVTFESDEVGVTITCAKSNYRLTVLDPADFPEFPTFVLDRSVELPSALLTTMVDKVYRATSNDNARPLLSGILMTVENNTIRLVATDSHRLAVCDTNVAAEGVDDGFEMIIPGHVFHDVLTIPSDTQSILIGSTDSQVVFVFGNTTYVSRRLEGSFPNFRQLLPDGYNTAVKINVDEFAAALKRVSVIAQANPKVRLEVDADASLMTLRATSPEQGEASETVSIEAEGESIAIALNFRYLFDCINAASDQDEISLELQEPMRPATFKSYSKINYLYLLMPTRWN
ncbi:DNA polymerase III subunit beta [Atopobiaceae bacterium SGI.236]